MLDPGQPEQLRKLAAQRGCSINEVVRQALEHYLGKPPPPADPGPTPIQIVVSELFDTPDGIRKDLGHKVIGLVADVLRDSELRRQHTRARKSKSREKRRARDTSRPNRPS